MYFLHTWIVLTQRWQRGNVGTQRGNVGNTIPVLLPLKEKFATILGRKNSLPREQKSLPKPQKTLHLRPKTLPKNPLILDGAEIFLEWLKEILRTEHRNSLLGAECGDANSARSKKRVSSGFAEDA